MQFEFWDDLDHPFSSFQKDTMSCTTVKSHTTARISYMHTRIVSATLAWELCLVSYSIHLFFPQPMVLGL